MTRKSKEGLERINEEFNRRYPGEIPARQPIHTVYGGAQLFSAETPRKIAQLAKKALLDYAPRPDELDRCLNLDPGHRIYPRVLAKLEKEAVEDFRIDFEDGYGDRSDEEEDRDAIRVAKEMAKADQGGMLPPFCGIRVKSLSEEVRARSLRTLDLFVTTLLEGNGGRLPDGFVVTLPKVIQARQAEAFARELAMLEKKLEITPATLRFEVMIEAPQLLLNRDGRSELPLLIDASDGRLSAAHFGAYDYTAACEITSADQSLTHPACDFARQMMKITFSGTGVRLADGATNVMPIGPHRAKAGEVITPAQLGENSAVVHLAWCLSYANIRHGLRQGFYQGWDLHPAQIPVRYAAVYSFFQENRRSMAERLRAFIDRAARATLSGNVFDDAASGQGLLNFFVRGASCGALTDEEIRSTGLTLEQLHTRSFRKITRSASERGS